ncbi:class II glutamine amidotransferase [Paraburkholderia caballeronis]|uniref:class II glutamine amidotransferase n=1 Tax=Paraburkholderia caballeronis TaxID=416943 RepID=UPI001066D975|nr:class II glutamine amidotransferase [Paraburkholderia caballeronis]TDV04930.1 glutamine amidotransferase [Paraburkholderia caballeronis]TDV07977.1 glutamine amidotransferase [Paraburkholderia caballeronis]TDV18703.1 glutamine amidotransferase [Paraburkholderia caballeronis]TDV33774.1 glutamine amidotransferase [Paraburkholderia caballeronis]
MCRWLAYSGNAVPLETVLFRARHSLIDQSLHSTLGVTTTNGDGFGLGWYQHPHDIPYRYRSVHPAWNDRNLRELARAVSAPMVVAHVRAATHTPVQETNCHPFRHRRWLFAHNGLIRDFPLMRRDLVVAIDPGRFNTIEGSTDSEVMFCLAMTFGLEHAPVLALERMAGFVEATGRAHGVREPLNMTVCASDGEQLIAVRYSSERQSRSLFHSTSFRHLHELYPDDPRIAAVGDDAYLIVSEPLVSLPDAWAEVPEATAIVVRGARIDYLPFTPRVD